MTASGLMATLNRAFGGLSPLPAPPSNAPPVASGDATPLTPAELVMADAEGWEVVDCGLQPDGHVSIQIHRTDCRPAAESRFSSDAEAWEHVVTRARHGSALHLHALATINPVEQALIEATCGFWSPGS